MSGAQQALALFLFVLSVFTWIGEFEAYRKDPGLWRRLSIGLWSHWALVTGAVAVQGALREITPTGEQQAPGTSFSSTWWRLVLHKHPLREELCAGSGRKV